MAKSLRELSKQRQKLKEIKGKDKRGEKKYQDRLERGEGEKSSVKKKKQMKFQYIAKYVLKEPVSMSVFLCFLQHWLVGYHDNPSQQLSADEVQQEEGEWGRAKDATHLLYRSINISLYLCLFSFLSISIQFSLNLLHWHDRGRIHWTL